MKYRKGSTQSMNCNKKSREFLKDLKTLFKILKNRRGLNTHHFIGDFIDYLEKEENLILPDETIYNYIDGRAIFPLPLGISLASFLAEKPRVNYIEVQEFVHKWYGRILPAIEKFKDAAREKEKKLTVELENNKKFLEW